MDVTTEIDRLHSQRILNHTMLSTIYMVAIITKTLKVHYRLLQPIGDVLVITSMINGDAGDDYNGSFCASNVSWSSIL